MSDETKITNIDLDLGNATLAAPLLPTQTLKCRVGECSVKKSAKDANMPGRLSIPLILEEPGVDQHGNPLAVGFTAYHGFLLGAHKGWTLERSQEEMLRAKVAIEGITEAQAKATPSTDLSAWTGKFVNATFSISKDGQNQNVRLSPCRS